MDTLIRTVQIRNRRNSNGRSDRLGVKGVSVGLLKDIHARPSVNAIVYDKVRVPNVGRNVVYKGNFIVAKIIS